MGSQEFAENSQTFRAVHFAKGFSLLAFGVNRYKIEKTVKAFSIFELRFLFRTENAVAGVAEAGDDVAMLV